MGQRSEPQRNNTWKNFDHLDTDSCDGERSIYEISNDQDVISSVEEKRSTLESRVETPSTDNTCISPSHMSPDLLAVFNLRDSSPYSNSDNVPPDTSKEMLSFHDRDFLPGWSEENVLDTTSVGWSSNSTKTYLQWFLSLRSSYLSIRHVWLLHRFSVIFTASFFSFVATSLWFTSLFFTCSSFSSVHVALSFLKCDSHLLHVKQICMVVRLR